MMLRRHVILSILLVFCLVAAVAEQVAATSLSIPVTPLSSEMRSLPITVYWMDSGVCSQEERNAIKNALDVALGILAGGAAELESEYPEGFQGFSSFKFKKVSDMDSARIVVTDARIEEGGSGRTIVVYGGDGKIYSSKIEIDCETASIGGDLLVTVILHELGHALGLDHTDFLEYNGIEELMYWVLTSPMVYPSTLDFYAIYQLVIKGYEGSSVSLPDWLPYGQVTPQGLILPEEGEGQEESGGEESGEGGEEESGGGGGTTEEEGATLSELEEKYEDLEEKYDSLSNTVVNLKNDVETLEDRVDELEERVDELEEGLEALENETATLEEGLNATEIALTNHTQQIVQLMQEVTWLNETLSRVNKTLPQLEDLLERISLLEGRLENLTLSFESFVEQMNNTQQEWLKKFASLEERQEASEKALEDQERALSEKITGVSQQLNDTKSELDLLRLRLMELKKEVEARDQEIIRLRRCGLFLFLLLLVSIILAAAGLSRASKAKKAVALLTGEG